MAREQQKEDGKGRAAQGDGINREGARRYDEGVREHARSGAPQREAREAERALDGPEGDQLRAAEREGKAAAQKKP